MAPPRRTLYVTGFAPGISARDLAYEFEEIGNIYRCDVMPPSRSGRGYAFVEFERASDAEYAYRDMHNRRIPTGDVLHIEWAKTPLRESRRRRQSDRPSRRSDGDSSDPPRSPGRGRRSPERWRSRSPERGRSPERRRSRSYERKRSESPERGRSRSSERGRYRSRERGRSRSPKYQQSRTPEKKSPARNERRDFSESPERGQDEDMKDVANGNVEQTTIQQDESGEAGATEPAEDASTTKEAAEAVAE